MIEMIFTQNSLEVSIKRNNKELAYMRCNYHELKEEVEIVDLDISETEKQQLCSEYLVLEAEHYAFRKAAKRIVSYALPEGRCENDDVQSIQWYEGQGFIHDHDVCGVVPCMVKKL